MERRERSDSYKIFTSFKNYYEILNTRASGSFATVKVGKYSITGENVAIKTVYKDRLDEQAISYLSSEISCLKLIQHVNVVKLYDLYESSTKLYLVMELGDGDLYEHIMDHYKLIGMPEDSVRYYFSQITSAIIYCHNMKIVHRDLKPQNIILFKSKNVVKLADFGFSKQYKTGEYLKTTCGSMPYTAPEILMGDLYDPKISDVWSLAVILYIMLTGQVPFDHINQSEMLTLVLDCKYTLPNFVSKEATELVNKMLLKDPKLRLKLDKILTSSFYIIDDIEIQKLNESKKINISKILHEYVLSEIDKHGIAKRNEVIKSLRQKSCDFISAAYYLIAGDAFKKAVGKDTINYILVVNDELLNDELLNNCNEKNNSLDLLTVEHTPNNGDILHQICKSMDDVSILCSKLSSSHSLKKPRKKITSISASTNTIYNNQTYNGLYYGRTVGSVSRKSLRSVGSKVIHRNKCSFRLSTNNNSSLQSLSELNLNETSNNNNQNISNIKVIQGDDKKNINSTFYSSSSTSINLNQDFKFEEFNNSENNNCKIILCENLNNYADDKCKENFNDQEKVISRTKNFNQSPSKSLFDF